jgi:uncharacterized protein
VQRTHINVWIDIDNPPQVQYLLPFEDAFRSRGAHVIITARDYGSTLELLAQRAASFHPVGAEFGRSTIAKSFGALKRARALTSLLSDEHKPDVLLCASRSSALAARKLRVPSFVIADYEFANLSFFRLTRSNILYPDVIDPSAFLASGVRQDHLIPFRGLKEDISLAGVDVAEIVPHCFPEIQDDSLVRVLFRPPAETSHYYNPESREFALRTLEYLAARPQALMVYSPRHEWQHDDLALLEWRNEPIVLKRAVPFVSLLKAVDLVVCSGGTMLRESAYLGIPAYSVFKGRIGAVDRHLAAIGRVHVIDSPDEFSTIELRKAAPLSPLRSNPRLLDELVDLLVDVCRGGMPRCGQA